MSWNRLELTVASLHNSGNGDVKMQHQSSNYHNLVKLESEESGEFSKRKDSRPHLRLLITTHTWFIRDRSRLSQCPSYRNIIYSSSCWYLYDSHFYSLASPKSARCISNVHILTCHVSLVHSRRLDCLTFRSCHSLLLHPCSSCQLMSIVFSRALLVVFDVGESPLAAKAA